MRAVRSTLWVGVLSLIICCPAAGADDAGKAQLAAKAHEILKANCYRCHGQNGTIEGGVNYVLDVKALVGRKKVIPGDPAKSKLYKRVTSEDNPMPPEDEKVRPSKSDVALLKQWIDAGAPDPAAAPPPRRAVTEADIIRHISDDLEKTDPADRRFVRYFTLCHLANAGVSEDELQSYRHALSKLVNSLSWGRTIVVPKPIDAGRTVLRIDLRDYKWSAMVWTRITGMYLYTPLLPDATAQAVYSALEWDVPYVRADWFVAVASRPPLYHWVLQLPRTDWELEKELKVTAAANIDGGLVARAGFNGSGISRHNRLVERHESSYGAYWKSYDFASSTGKQNLFAFPFGPGLGVKDFYQDGGEIIFTLPNGLHGYMLVDGQGKQINEGPTKIVSDPKQPDKAVVNGLSCMSCHSKGLIEKDDQVRDHVARNPGGFTEAEAIKVKATYPPKDKFNALIREDQAKYKAAIEKTGGRMTATDPVATLALGFDQELDLKQAAAEAGLSPDEFVKRMGKSPHLSRTLGSLNVDGGTVQRRNFVLEFHAVIRDMKLGTPRTVFNSVNMVLRYVPAGEFDMGSADDDTVTRANERPHHLVRITRPFYMGAFAVTQEQYQRVMGKNPATFGPREGSPGDCPVESVAWSEARAFCQTLSDMEEEKRAGRRYRLPTEAEWEYACRAGTTTRFYFGDAVSHDFANYDGSRFGRPNRGGGFPPNRFGLYDMHGNVWNMCADWYEPGYYRHSPVNDPPGPRSSRDQVRVMRGGSFAESHVWMRSASRNAIKPDEQHMNVGFRVICEQE